MASDCPPLVLIVGGPDVDSRLDLMTCLQDEFHFEGVGSNPTLRGRFASAGFGYHAYQLSRGADPVRDLRSLGQLSALFRRKRPQIVHTFDAKPGVVARLAARLAGVPIVIGTLPGLGSLYASDRLTVRLTRRVYQPLQRLACHWSDLTMFQNRQDLHRFVALKIVPLAKTEEVTGSGVRTDLIDPALFGEADRGHVRDELGVPRDAVLLTMVSRVMRTKGVNEFAAAARLVQAQYPNSNFLLVGPGDTDSIDRLSPEQLARLSRDVNWIGPRQDIPAILAATDMFVFPSFYREGIPRVLLEAAAMGLPIVTTDMPGCNDVVEHEVNGLLVPPRDPEALAQAVLRLISDPGMLRRLGHASRLRAVARFDLSLVADQTRAIYRKLLKARGLWPQSLD